MKLLVILALVILGQSAYADTMEVGCSVMTHDCMNMPSRPKKCGWGYDIGTVNSVGLQKSGTGPDYEIWQGTFNATARDKYPYKVEIYQRREANQAFNFVTLTMNVDKDVTISAIGQTTADLRYRSNMNNQGIGLHCTTDLVSAP